MKGIWDLSALSLQLSVNLQIEIFELFKNCQKKLNNLLCLTSQDGIYVVECLKVCFLSNCGNFII